MENAIKKIIKEEIFSGNSEVLQAIENGMRDKKIELEGGRIEELVLTKNIDERFKGKKIREILKIFRTVDLSRVAIAKKRGEEAYFSLSKNLLMDKIEEAEMEEQLLEIIIEDSKSKGTVSDILQKVYLIRKKLKEQEEQKEKEKGKPKQEKIKLPPKPRDNNYDDYEFFRKEEVEETKEEK